MTNSNAISIFLTMTYAKFGDCKKSKKNAIKFIDFTITYVIVAYIDARDMCKLE